MEEYADNSRHRHKRRHRARMPVLLTVLVVMMLVVVVSFAVISSVPFSVILEGEEEIVLEFGQDFVDPGASAVLGGNKSNISVVADGEVFVGELGTYKISYRAHWLWRSAVSERSVTIVDTTAPTIVLKYTDSVTLPGEEYIEEGFIAEDNYDGDISDSVLRTVEGDKICYTVTDSSGNTTSVTRTVQYGDYLPPKLELLGEQTVTVKAGSFFSEPGYTAEDNLDGDLTGQVEITGDYDLYTPGTYTIVYEVTDSAGNTSKAERTLVVEKVVQPDAVDPGDKVIYLTFDDGPTKNTLELLEILDEYNVKATFFVVGSMSLGYLDDIVSHGHSIGIHCNTHTFSEIYVSEEAFLNDLTTMRQKIYNYTGVDTTLMRFPGGSSNTVSRNYCQGIMTQLSQTVTDLGYQYFDWNVDSNDAGGAKTADEVYNNVINGVRQRNVSIVLQHDLYKYSVDAVERIIQWGLANGYTFLPLDPTSPTAHHGINN